MPSWPLTLPQAPMVNGFSKKLRVNFVSTQVAQGYQRRRRRFTGKIHDILVDLPPLTTEELETFETFYNSTLESGSLEFDWQDFSTDPREAVTYRFGDAPPNISAATDRRWNVSFSLELRS